MGWSATAKACGTMDKIFNLCNTSDYHYHYKGNKYFFDRGKEYQDGHINLQIYKSINQTHCIKYGNIYIETNGEIRQNKIGIKQNIQ